MLVGSDNTLYTLNYYTDNIGVISPSGATRYIGHIGEYNSYFSFDNDGNFISVAHNAKELYVTTPAGVSTIIGNTTIFPRRPMINTNGDIFLPNYESGSIQKFSLAKKRLLTVDAEGNVVKNFEEISQKWVQSFVENYIKSTTPLVINSENTIPMNANSLNFNYPTAVIGTRIQCSNISSGPMIYEKIINGWVEYSTTRTSLN
jgi:hypothetical protein